MLHKDVKLSLNEIQNKELELLKKIDVFCQENNLNYFLAYGTLIGCIRHKGFIPWDDDIDIIMPRPDYNRLLSLKDKFHEEFENTSIEFLDEKTYYPYIKVYDLNTLVQEKRLRKEFSSHIWVDIFPLDGASENMKRNKSLLLRQKIMMKILASIKVKPFKMNGNFFIKILGTIFIPFGILLNYFFNFAEYINNLSQSISYDNSKKVANTAEYGYGLAEIVDKKDLFPVLKKKFCGVEFNVPKNYHEYLTQLYGDYMQLPSENKRLSHYLDAWEL